MFAGYNGFSGVLIMLVFVVVPEKLHGQKGVTKRMRKKNMMNFWAF